MPRVFNIEVTLFVPSNIRADKVAEARRLLKGAGIEFRETKHPGLNFLFLVAGCSIYFHLDGVRSFIKEAQWIRRFVRRSA